MGRGTSATLGVKLFGDITLSFEASDIPLVKVAEYREMPKASTAAEVRAPHPTIAAHRSERSGWGGYIARKRLYAALLRCEG